MTTQSLTMFLVLLGLVTGRPVAAQSTNAPVLGMVTVGKQTIWYWSGTASNYVLQRTTNLVTGNWVTVTNGSPLTAVALTNTVVPGFFRLYLPAGYPVGMTLIPDGGYTMGDALDGESDATPTVVVTVNSFYLDVNLVTYAQWQTVYAWATSHGYGFVNAGAGKAAGHPVQTVDWYDAVKWCNARSQQAGLAPAYYTDAALTQVYTNGEVTPYVNWTVAGYRLPTEAEWEKAARGGLAGQRFPWGNTISESQANYYGEPASLAYDLGPAGENVAFSAGGYPMTSPAGFFVANGLGVYDMAGNVFEWCWDWYGTPYAGGTNPHGPATGSNRLLRGGDWFHDANHARTAYRNYNPPATASGVMGFRCVRGI